MNQAADMQAVVAALREPRPVSRHLAREPRRRCARVAARHAPRARSSSARTAPWSSSATAPLPAEYAFLALDGHGLLRELPADHEERVLVAVDCAQETRLTDQRLLEAPLVVNIDHHHDNTRFGTVEPRRCRGVVDRGAARRHLPELGVELTPEIAEALYTALVTDTGRFQYTNTTPKAFRLAADLVAAGADAHKVFQGVYESVQFAKLKLLARALERAEVYAGGRVVVSYLLRNDFPEVGAVEPYSEGIIDSLRAVEGAQLAALIREPHATAARPARSRCARRWTRSTCRRSRGRSAEAGIRRRQGSRATCRSKRSPASSSPSSRPPPTALAAWADGDPEGSRPDRDHPRRQAGRAVVVRRRGVRASPHRAKTGHAGTLDPFATGLLLLLSGRATKLASCFVGLDKRYLTDIDLSARTATGDPEGDVVERHEPLGGSGAGGRAGSAPRRDRAADPGGVGREDRR